MAQAVPPYIHDLLTEAAEPLLQLALQGAEASVPVHDGATPAEVERAYRVGAVVLAFQASLRTPAVDGMSEFDVVMALASVCGTIMAQVSEPSTLYQAFQAQFAAVLKEVGEAQRRSMQ